jgi:Ecdysteroid kinase-like family
VQDVDDPLSLAQLRQCRYRRRAREGWGECVELWSRLVLNNVPTTTSEVTPAWLTDALHRAGSLPAEATIVTVHSDPTTAGVGFMGEVGKIAVTYAGDSGDAPTKMIVKFPTASPQVMAMMRPTRVYEREHRFYAEIADASPLRTPKVFHITCDTSDDPDVAESYMLVMEDLSDLELGDQVAGLSLEQTAAALSGLAKHHASFWNGAGMEQAGFIPVINGPLNRSGQAIYEASLPGFKQVFGGSLLPEMVPVADAYARNHPLLLDRFAALPHTLVHFDYRADNLLFDRSDGGCEVAVIDWQSISKGGGAADVGYLLGQNLDSQLRRDNEADLLHGYHDTLARNGVVDYEYDDFFDHYRLGLIYGWVIPVFAVGSLDSSSERAMQLWTNVLHRVQDAIFQHGAQEFIA